jgi:SAM-dependent methyltransferase
VSQFHFDPATYLDLIHAEIPCYDGLQERLARATEAIEVRRVLDLGTGTGETARRVRELHAQAAIVVVDESPGMLDRINFEVERHVQRLQDDLPRGAFDLVVSALAVHHLDAAEKRDLFQRVHAAVRRGGRFVLADVVLAKQQVAPLSDGYDKPDTAADQLAWLLAAGFAASIVWEQDDLALLVADRP